jgi:hypothetical protein
MKTTYLFPNSYKRLGLFLFIPTFIFGLYTLISDYEPTVLDINVFALFVDEIMGEKKLFAIIENNVLNEILGVLMIISSVLLAFSKEKDEDEFISKIRLESLVWATYVSYTILIFGFVFVYDLSFFWWMIINMYTILFFFIIRFNWKISRIKKTLQNEE